MTGRKLLHYELLARIGVGGMGEVWRARDSRLNREVAIKILPPDGTTSILQERFLREARAASALIHPNIITVHEINSADGTDFIVMEYVRGEALSATLAGGPLPVERAILYAIQICDALRAAHEAGVVHRDLKPGNIMIARSGLVKVVDFGIAKRLGGADPDLDETSAALTVKGMAVGTPAYMSPEQTLGDPVDARSDLFSFGVVLYQMLAGVLPFQATTTLTLVRQIVHEAPKPLRSVAAGVPPALAAIVEKCLQKSPDDRYPTAAALGDDLRRVTVATGKIPALDDRTRTTMRAAAPDASPHRFPRRVVVVVGCVIAFAVTAWLGGPSLLRWLRDRDAATSAVAAADAGASPRELYQRAAERLRFSYREGNLQKGIEQLERALQLQPSYPLAAARLSLAYSRKNEVSADPQWQRLARAHADRAVAEDPNLALAHMAQGRALVQAGELEKALEAYTRAQTLDPANWELLWRLGDLAVRRKQPAAAAEDYFTRSVQAGPEEWEAATRLGTFYYREGRYNDAARLYERAVDLAPDNPRSPANLAAVYHHLGRTDEAAAVLQRSLAIAPDSLTYSNLGTLLFFQGKYPEAVSAFERAVQLGANTYLYWGNLGDAARMTPGGAAKAKEAYTRAIQLSQEKLSKSPSDVDLRSSMALYLIRDGQQQKALIELDTVLAQKTLPASVLFKATIVAELAGQRARALDLLERSLAGGYQFREISQEPDLVTLRTDPRYHKLAARYQK